MFTPQARLHPELLQLARVLDIVDLRFIAVVLGADVHAVRLDTHVNIETR